MAGTAAPIETAELSVDLEHLSVETTAAVDIDATCGNRATAAR
jgi:hypothetical protein